MSDAERLEAATQNYSRMLAMRDAEKSRADAAERERDELRGKLALIHEAYWLAIADMPHASFCPMAECQHRPAIEECPCRCLCWRSAADKVDDVDEALRLCTRVRDLEDELEARPMHTADAAALAEVAMRFYDALDIDRLDPEYFGSGSEGHQYRGLRDAVRAYRAAPNDYSSSQTKEPK